MLWLQSDYGFRLNSLTEYYILGLNYTSVSFYDVKPFYSRLLDF